MSIIFPENSIIFDEKHLIKGRPRWQQVNPPALYDYPHNCIGWITINANHQSVTSGSGFLVSSSIVLTSAHIFALTKKGKDCVYFPSTSQITFTLMDENAKSPISIKVKSIRISSEYERISNQINLLVAKRDEQADKIRKNELKDQIVKLHQEEMKNDFAMLELESEITRNQYFKLPKNIQTYPQPQLVVSGYVSDPHTGLYRHWTHFQTLAEIKYRAAFYDIDTEKGQSGSPAYLRYGDKIILIGIHKGYSLEDNLNYCTIITKQIIAILQGWVMDMKGSLKDLNLQVNIPYNSEDINLLKQQIIRLSSQKDSLEKELTKNKDQLKKATKEIQQNIKQYESTIKELNKEILFRKTQNSNLSIANNELRQDYTQKDMILKTITKENQQQFIQITKLKYQVNQFKAKQAQQFLRLSQQEIKVKKSKSKVSKLLEKEEQISKLKSETSRLSEINQELAVESDMKNSYLQKCSHTIQQLSTEIANLKCQIRQYKTKQEQYTIIINQYKEDVDRPAQQSFTLSDKNNNLIKQINLMQNLYQQKKWQQFQQLIKKQKKLLNNSPIKQDYISNEGINNKNKTITKTQQSVILLEQ